MADYSMASLGDDQMASVSEVSLKDATPQEGTNLLDGLKREFAQEEVSTP